MCMANGFGSLTRGQGSVQGRSCSPVHAVLVGLSLVMRALAQHRCEW